MRLTSPRWASAISKLTGKGERAATVNWLGSFSSHDSKRRDVINPELCDEALDLLRPSLPPPSTCDIIDINPGAGVWSQRLHEVLKPRRHVFIETEYGNYQDALAPLLQQEESPYRIAPSIVDALDEHQDYLSTHLRQSYGNPIDSSRQHARQSPTSQLIITANLAQRGVRSNGFVGEMSKLFFEHFYRNTAMGTGAFPWHKYGLVKLLAWVPEVDKYSFNPRCASFRWRGAKQLEASCDIREIVASFPNDGLRSQLSPWHGAVLQSMREVAAVQSKNEYQPPPHRRQPMPQPPSIFLSPIEENFPLFQSIQGRPALVNQYIAAHKTVKELDPEWLEKYLNDGRFVQSNRIADKNDPRKIFSQYYIRMRTTHARYAKVDNLACAQVELERQIVAFRKEHPRDIKGYWELVEKLQPRFDMLREQRTKFFKDNRSAAMKAIDDYRALNHNPHLLHWNQRTFEPILCRARHDFFPHIPMTLLEVTPRPSFVNTINTADLQIVWDYLCHIFDFSRTVSIKEAIESLVGDGEAYELFVGKFGEPGGIPSLTDPLLGGSHDLSNVRLRTMSIQQLMDITLAYEAWPWRVGLNDMINAVSTFSGGGKVL